MKTVIHFSRILLGLVFILSAIAKLISIDEFEIYVFSHGLLNFDLASLTARLLIGFEFFIGIMLVVNLYFRHIWLLAFVMLSGFTVYLAFLAISGSDGNCHCFGEMFDMGPIESMLKNGILILGLIAIRKGNNFQLSVCKKTPTSSLFSQRIQIIYTSKLTEFVESKASNLTFSYQTRVFLQTQLKRQGLISMLILVFSIILPNTISPPDFAYSDFDTETSTIDKNKLDSLILNNDEFPIKFDNRKKVLCFYSPKCRFCKLAEQKMSAIVQRNHLDTSSFANIFFGKPSSLDEFYHPDAIRFEHAFIKSRDFMTITGGEMPLILLVENKKIIHTFGYRSVDESILVNFLK